MDVAVRVTQPLLLPPVEHVTDTGAVVVRAGLWVIARVFAVLLDDDLPIEAWDGTASVLAQLHRLVSRASPRAVARATEAREDRVVRPVARPGRKSASLASRSSGVAGRLPSLNSLIRPACGQRL